MNDLKVTLVQAHLHWEDAPANRRMFEDLLSRQEGSDIIFLPEMFSTGFSMNPAAHCEEMDGPSVMWMKEMASFHKSVVTGSLIIKEGENFYNRLIWCEPNGELKWYDKRHRFTYAGEHKEYSRGNARPTWEYRGWRIRPQICYDLRFPVWSRNDDDYDILFYVANWPARRSYPWSALLRARAIENMAYVIGLNRVGEDGSGVDHSGNSVVLDSLGEEIAQAEPHAVQLLSAVLKKEKINEARERFHFLDDRDIFRIDVDQ